MHEPQKGRRHRGPALRARRSLLGKDGIVTGAPLEVDGTLTLSNGATVGSPGSPINAAHLLGGCGGHACAAADGVYATSLDTCRRTSPKPAVDLAGWYANAKPGPSNACTTGNVPGGFDNDGNGPERQPGGVQPDASVLIRLPRDRRLREPPRAVSAGRRERRARLTVAGTIFIDGPLSHPGERERRLLAGGQRSTRRTLCRGARTLASAVSQRATPPGTRIRTCLMLVAGDSGTSAYTMDKNATFQGESYAVGELLGEEGRRPLGPASSPTTWTSRRTPPSTRSRTRCRRARRARAASCPPSSEAGAARRVGTRQVAYGPLRRPRRGRAQPRPRLGQHVAEHRRRSGRTPPGAPRAAARSG